MTNSYRYVFVSSTPQLPSTGTTVDLATGQVGIFDAKTYSAVTAPSFTLNKSIILAQGTSPDKFPKGISKGNQTRKTDPIKPSDITSWNAYAARPAKGMAITLGYDGVDITKTLNVSSGENFTFWITLTGQPVGNLLGDTPTTHSPTWTEEFTVVLPCVSNCTDSCGASVDCNVVADAAISEFLTRKLPGDQFLSDFVKVTKLIRCDTPSSLPTVATNTWSLTIADTGDNVALGRVQAAYSGIPVVRLSYVGIFSTYSIVEVSQPAAFNTSASPLIPNCTVCPSGYSLVPQVWLYAVKRSGVPVLSTIKTDYSDTTAILLSFDGAVSTYEIHKTTATVPSAVASDIIISAGTFQSVCLIGSPTTTPWSLVSSCISAQNDFLITLKNDSCGSNYLTALQAEYSTLGTVSLVATNPSSCTSQYKITVTSDNVSCETCDMSFFTFTTPPAFQGSVWVQVLGETGYGVGCNCGLKFESIYEQRKAQECFLKSVPYEYEPLFVNLSTRNPDPNNYAVLCETDVPVTIVQNVQYAMGWGQIVADELIRSNYQFNEFWYKNPAERDAMSYQLGINLQGYYDQYTLEFNIRPDEYNGISGFGTSPVQHFEWTFYYPQGQGTAFAQAINGYLASAGSSIDPVNI